MNVLKTHGAVCFVSLEPGQPTSLPPEEISWILRPEQFTGKEIFTMGGDKRYIKAVDLGPRPVPEGLDGTEDGKVKRPGLRLVK